MGVSIVARLEDTRSPAVLSTLHLIPSNGYAVQAIDTGFPEVRGIASNKTDADGTYDISAHFGARPVTLVVGLNPDVVSSTNQALVEALRAFMHPRLRPALYYTIDGGSERRIELRADQSTFVDQFVEVAYGFITCGWRAPKGIIESGTLTTETLEAGSAALGGRAYDLDFDVSFPGAGVLGEGLLTVGGVLPVDPVIRLYGPCTDPAIVHVDQAKVMSFDGNGGITLGAGEYLEVDVSAKTVTLSTDGSSKYDRLNVAESDWITLEPGDNRVRFVPYAFTAGSEAVFTYRAAWL